MVKQFAIKQQGHGKRDWLIRFFRTNDCLCSSGPRNIIPAGQPFYFIPYLYFVISLPRMFRYGIIFILLYATLACQASGKESFSKSQNGFIENKGQIIDQNNNPNPAVLYLLNTPGMNVQLRRGGFSYDLFTSPPGPISATERGRTSSKTANPPLSLGR